MVFSDQQAISECSAYGFIGIAWNGHSIVANLVDHECIPPSNICCAFGDTRASVLWDPNGEVIALVR